MGVVIGELSLEVGRGGVRKVRRDVGAQIGPIFSREKLILLHLQSCCSNNFSLGSSLRSY